MDRSTPGLSEEACRLIALLVARMRDGEAERARRWPDHPAVREWARERALEQRLLVPSPNWFHEVSFDLDGRIIVRLDTGNAATYERPPNALEAHLTWQCYVPATWPELGAFAPARPKDAVACPGCDGHGFHPDPEGPHANVTCFCGNAGWLPAVAAGLQAFVDFAPEM